MAESPVPWKLGRRTGGLIRCRDRTAWESQARPHHKADEDTPRRDAWWIQAGDYSRHPPDPAERPVAEPRIRVLPIILLFFVQVRLVGVPGKVLEAVGPVHAQVLRAVLEGRMGWVKGEGGIHGGPEGIIPNGVPPELGFPLDDFLLVLVPVRPV